MQNSITNRIRIIGIVITAGCIYSSCKTAKPVSQATVNSQPAAIKINLQQRRTYSFSDGTVQFSNQFAGARVNNIEQQDNSHYTITISPENTPVNPSPWYAFKVWGKQQTIDVQMKYVGTRHRYDPKISKDGGKTWEDLAVKKSKTDSNAGFQLSISADTLLVAAQELMPAAMGYQWIDSLATLPFIHKEIVGYSIMGKPIVALNTTGSSGKKQIIILSRQHPPEVTGYMAMQEFIRTVMGNSSLAVAFRKEYEVIVVPMLNPDGVDEGNWRHSAGGVDLNRDWENFEQPETRSVKEFLVKKQTAQQATVYFAIDFHSTYNDVFYTNEDTLTNVPGLTNRWLRRFAESIPGFKPNVKPSGNGGNVSKGWLMRAFKTDALTYEVGDDTPRPLLKKKGKVAAEVLMQLLLRG
ncbi:MAG: M14 family metallopeptidase [Chitinophagaceae bacterium]